MVERSRTSIVDRALALIAGRALAESVAGDLEERRRVSAGGVGGAVRYWLSLIGIAAYVFASRIVASVRAAVASGFGLRGAPRDCRHAVRSLWRAPWFSSSVIGVIALSMAIATTVFAVVDGVLFRPLPYPHADHLVTVQPGFKAPDPAGGREPTGPSLAEKNAWAAALPDIAMTAFDTSALMQFSGDQLNEPPVGALWVQSNFFDVVGVQPLVGGFAAADFRSGPDRRAVIISYDLWQRRLGGAVDVVGRRLGRGAGPVFEIAGVMPRGFVFPSVINAQMLLPIQDDAPVSGRGGFLLARLPGWMTPRMAQARLEAVMTAVAPTLPAPPVRLAKFYAQVHPFDRVAVRPIAQTLGATSRPLLLAVFLAAALVVLLACANVSSLLAARRVDAARDVALRRALGAGAADLARIVLAESAVIVVAGNALGLMLARPLLASMVALLPQDLALLKAPAIDWRVAAFSALASAVSVACVSLWPIRVSVRSSPASGLADGARATARSRGRALVVALQVSLGLVLTMAGALMVGSVLHLRQADVGVDTAHVVAVNVGLPGMDAAWRAHDAAGLDMEAARLSRLITRIRALPHVVAAGATDASLLAHYRNDSALDPVGGQASGWVEDNGVMAGFFDVMRPRLRAGRLPTPEEIDAGRHVAVVSQSVARMYWPSANPIGQVLLEDSRYYQGDHAFTVVGVVDDARLVRWDSTKVSQVYAPIAAMRSGLPPNVVIRTDGTRGADDRVLADALRLVREEEPTIHAYRAGALDDMLADTVRPRRLQSWIFGSFAAAALAIVGAGVLGLVAMTTARRTREIGIRMALGATRDGVIGLIVREQMAPVTAGLIAGGALAWWAVRFLQKYLYDLSAYDPRVWLATVVLIAAVAAIGALIPSLRASHVDPVRALRSE